jgi:NADH-quinone oxidoreductase subunit H
VTFVVIPFAAPIPTAKGIFTFQAADLNVGILYILAMTSLGVYGVMLAGWASNNKFALLGGLRSSSQMVSYELSMGLAVMSVLMLTGSFALGDIAATQTANVLRWNCFRLPLACLIFIVSAFAETNRAPFDLPEGESELVAGYHVEYSSMKFALFMMSEYINMTIASALIVTLFFGGWQVPFVATETLRSQAPQIMRYGLISFSILSIVAGGALCARFRRGHYGDKRDYEVLVFGVPAVVVGLGVLSTVFLSGPFLWAASTRMAWAAVFQILVFLAKILFMCWVFIWVRWTLPRFRYDQLMTLGWKYLLPLALGQVIFVAIWLLL